MKGEDDNGDDNLEDGIPITGQNPLTELQGVQLPHSSVYERLSRMIKPIADQTENKPCSRGSERNSQDNELEQLKKTSKNYERQIESLLLRI